MLNRNRIVILSLILFFRLSTGELKSEKHSDKNRLIDIQAYIDREVKAGKRRIILPKGRWRVVPQKKAHLLLKDLQDIEIIGYNAEMICTETTRAITIENCRNLTIKGLVIDYDPLPFTQGKITAIAPDKKWFEFEIFNGYPDKGIKPFKLEIFDPETMTLRTGTYDGFSVEKRESSVYRIIKRKIFKYDPKRHLEQTGDTVVIGTDISSKGQIPHAVYSTRCINLNLKEIILYASNCFGFLETYCSGTKYYKCRIDRRPLGIDLKKRAVPRVRSLNADAFHSKHAERGPAIIGCTARFMGDDCINITGDYHFITACKGKELRVLAKRDMNMESGDPVHILTYQGEHISGLKVLRIEPDARINEEERRFLAKQKMNLSFRYPSGRILTRAFKILLDRKVDIHLGSVICSANRIGNGFTVMSNDFGFNRSRGILIKAGNGVIEHNKLTGNWMAAIKIAPEFWWLEAGSSANVMIRNNSIKECRDIAIAVYANGGSGDISPAGAHHNIRIIDNSITDCPQPAILVTSTRGLKIENNILKIDKTKKILPWVLHSFKLNKKKLEPIMTINTEDAVIK